MPGSRRAAAAATTRKSDWYVWADPKPDGTPPNNWLSIFGGSAWQWEPRRGQYYLHNFLVSQPDLNYHNPAVAAQMLEEAEFWLARGVDGFRLDAINFCFHDPLLRDNPPKPAAERTRARLPRRQPVRLPGPPVRQHAAAEPRIPRVAAAADGPLRARRLARRGLRRGRGRGDRPVHVRQPAPAHGLQLRAAGRRFLDRAHPRGRRHARRALPGLLAVLGDRQSRRRARRLALVGRRAAAPRARSCSTRCCFRCAARPAATRARSSASRRRRCRTRRCRTPTASRSGRCSRGATVAARRCPGTTASRSADSPAAVPGCRFPAEHRALAVNRQEAAPDSVLNAYRSFVRWRREQPALRSGGIRLFDSPEGTLVFLREHDGAGVLACFNFGAHARRHSQSRSRCARAARRARLRRFDARPGGVTVPAHGAFFAACPGSLPLLIRCAAALLVALGFASGCGSAAVPRIERIEPAHWWAEHEESAAAAPRARRRRRRTRTDPSTIPRHAAQRDPHREPELPVPRPAARARCHSPGPSRSPFRRGGRVVLTAGTSSGAREAGSAARRGFGPADALYLAMPDRFANGDASNDSVPRPRREGEPRGSRWAPRRRPRRPARPAATTSPASASRSSGSIRCWRATSRAAPITATRSPISTGWTRGSATTRCMRASRAEARALGIGLVMDVILNHCGSRHWWMKDLPDPDWINHGEQFVGTTHRRETLWDPHASQSDFAAFADGWFVPSMPDLNQRHPQLATYLDAEHDLVGRDRGALGPARRHAAVLRPRVPRTVARSRARGVSGAHDRRRGMERGSRHRLALAAGTAARRAAVAASGER